ncbi:ribonuclease [Streptomyces agglomeratus]|uniref:endonuclease I family protein n=1 Tax=Streptomyces agglomeratus TaxID=285458 RepID=UPI0008525543|nr:endonuclease [Streptomyces agglomeratus]OEJ37475.1 ribonuclease [Streptomyces agglomeratus]OEJ48141.1 ribonuclease [Streptomyces agglomeratus]OEJ50016.1 ribonuclease [Streptomyces agglomeratus]OEJ57345.1 ribonuclease [Streptomyces agglomeratus]
MSRRNNLRWAAALVATASIGMVTVTPTQARPAAAPADSAATAAVAASDPSTYYAAAAGKTGAALKSSLYTIISTQSTVSYDQVWTALKNTDQDPANTANVIELYTGKSIAKTRNGGNTGDWNREHVWAKSHGDFGTSTGPGTDLHHLRPEDVTVNSIRGNKDFDNGGTAVSGAAGNYTDADSFEPRSAVKGDVARMILYMAVRYDGGDGFADLEPNDRVSNGSLPAIGRLSVLKQWSLQDPPDTFEKRRNEIIYNTYQRNRNPFIDHPEWVESIW